MKRQLGNRKSETRIVVLLLALATSAVQGQTNYTLDWFTVDGGGGTSTGGVFSLSGTIGQPDAATTMSGGSFSVDGGDWSLITAVPTPGGPSLSIALTATNTAILSWPSPATGFVLEETSDLGTTNWSNPGLTPSDNGTIKTVVVPVDPGTKFYRLRKP